MNPERAKLWREAIFSGIVEIRLLSRHNAQGTKAVEVIQAIADWSHNIAQFSTKDFDGFNETHSLEEAKYFLLPHRAELRGNLTIVLRQLGLEI